jgi:hypothetical protein
LNGSLHFCAEPKLSEAGSLQKKISPSLVIVHRQSRNATGVQQSRYRERRGLAAKGLTGKLKTLGKWIYEINPLRPLAGRWHCSRTKSRNARPRCDIVIINCLRRGFWEADTAILSASSPGNGAGFLVAALPRYEERLITD